MTFISEVVKLESKAEAYDLEVAAIEVIPLTLSQDGSTRFDLLPVAAAPLLLPEFRGIPSDKVSVWGKYLYMA